MASDFNPADRAFMAQALRLAAQGLYTTTPNPRVGCLVVQGEQIVGEGWHARAGEPHAEALALAQAGDRARGATLYVTLEPCNHHGRTPPCAQAVIAAGVSRVVIAMADPNPKAAGGADALRAAGITVEAGLLEHEARELNIGFISRVTRGRPWVRMKVAASLDGRTALEDGTSQWITGEAARRDGHHWRARACAVLTGIGTVKDDDPRLNVRAVATTRQPLRVLVDSRLEVSPDARLLQGDGGPLLVISAVDDAARIAVLRERGAEVLVMPNPHGKTDLAAILAELGRRGINELHVEAGTRLNGSLLREGCVDELLVYLAPSMIGDTGRAMASLPALASLTDQKRLRFTDVLRIGDDLRLMARMQNGAAQQRRS
jgi:diaminohydroxyphosphoribosylaminopyrimidine deaminase/5-amino-6-(5-phosphoribosylamino)uracil reductase